jgi:hypothetical protein
MLSSDDVDLLIARILMKLRRYITRHHDFANYYRSLLIHGLLKSRHMFFWVLITLFRLMYIFCINLVNFYINKVIFLMNMFIFLKNIIIKLLIYLYMMIQNLFIHLRKMYVVKLREIIIIIYILVPNKSNRTPHFWV